jgi:nitronate monooxygenase
MGGFAFIPRVVDIVKLPVMAAGGIADGRGLAAAFALGAEGVQIGTAFLPCAASAASAAYRSALSSAAAKNTGLTEAFTGRPARRVRSRLMDGLAEVNDPALPFPLQHAHPNGCGTRLDSRNSRPL